MTGKAIFTLAIVFAATTAMADLGDDVSIPIKFTMPKAGYVSLILQDENGQVVRQLLNCKPTDAGDHTVTWDALTTPVWKTPGDAVPAGKYTWKAIRHDGIGLKLRGWAYQV